MTTMEMHPTGRATVFVVVRDVDHGVFTRKRSVVFGAATLAPNGLVSCPRANARLLAISPGFDAMVRKLLA